MLGGAGAPRPESHLGGNTDKALSPFEAVNCDVCELHPPPLLPHALPLLLLLLLRLSLGGGHLQTGVR